MVDCQPRPMSSPDPVLTLIFSPANELRDHHCNAGFDLGWLEGAGCGGICQGWLRLGHPQNYGVRQSRLSISIG